jgi:predicted DNA-binding transcriptional regulator YafY
MSRAARLLDLIQALRRHRRPVTASRLAESLGVSERTIYRDVLTLNAQGADIRGEAGLGYVLSAGFTLPPLMFTDDEIEAIVLGLRWVKGRADAKLARGASDASAKIADVLPKDLRERAEATELHVPPPKTRRSASCDLSLLREAMRTERKLQIGYADANKRKSERKIWPLLLGFFNETEVLAAWCETRKAFRHFRTDRIVDATVTTEPLPQRRRSLVAQWRRTENAPILD